MIVTVEVLSEETQEFDGKKGRQRIQRLACLDRDPKVRFKQTFDYDLEGEEKDRYTGKLEGKKLTLGITDIVVFGGRYRARGMILSVDGQAAAQK